MKRALTIIPTIQTGRTTTGAERLHCAVRILHDVSNNIHVHQETHTTETSEKPLASLCCAHRDHCRAEAVSCGVSGSRQGRAMTGLSVRCWTGDSWGQRFTVPSAPSLSPRWLWEAQGKGLMRTTRKHRGIWQRPFPPHPEGQQSCSVAARRGKQGAYCDINMDGGCGGVRLPPSVGVSYREAQCEAEEGGGGAAWWHCKCAQNKRIWINKIGKACVHETPRPSIFSKPYAVRHRKHTQCQMVSHWHQTAICQCKH